MSPRERVKPSPVDEIAALKMLELDEVSLLDDNDTKDKPSTTKPKTMCGGRTFSLVGQTALIFVLGYLIGLNHFPRVSIMDAKLEVTRKASLSEMNAASVTVAENHSAISLRSRSSKTPTSAAAPMNLMEKIVVAPSNKTEYQTMDAMCTLRRYAHLLARFCDPLDRSHCDLDAARAHFQEYEHGQLEWGCPLGEAICYARRYGDLLRGYCHGEESQCNYYGLRKHYEKWGIKGRRVWGCEAAPFEAAATVLERVPLTTLDKLPSSKRHASVLGKASLETFTGTWEPVGFNEQDFPKQPICPNMVPDVGKSRFCDLRAREGYQPARYVAKGLPAEFPAKRFHDKLKEDGGIAFVGDSLMLQMFKELSCMLEAAGERSSTAGIFYSQTFMAPFPDHVFDLFEDRGHKDHQIEAGLSMKWVQKLIERKPKYAVFNTGAWWNPRFYRHRGEWCDYENWETATREDMIRIYAETMEETVLPLLTSLAEDHDIIPIWRDTPPGGVLDPETLKIVESNQYVPYYYTFPRYNEIGRDIVARAGGLVLPLWDVSVQRWNDHVFSDGEVSNDLLHWCAYHGEQSVPGVWVRLLAQVLYGDLSESAETSQLALMPEPVKVSTPGNKTVASDQANGEKGRRSLVDPVPIVPLSKTPRCSCPCSDATNYKKCRANLRCSWDVDAEICLERFGAES